MKVTRYLLKVILYGIVIIAFFESANVVYAATNTIGDYTYSTDGSATKVESVVADTEFYNFECKTTYASGRTTKHKFYEYLINYNAYFTIPGLRQTNVLGENCDTMTPQSICAVDNLIVIGAYDSDEKCNSVMYILLNGELVATMVMPNDTHMGAMAYDGKTLWVGDTVNDRMIGYTYNDLGGAIYYTKASGAKSVMMNVDDCPKISLKTNPSFATYYDGVLWVGKYEDSIFKDTPYIYGYNLTYSGNKLNSCVAKYEMEAPLKTQGMTFYKHSPSDTLYLVISQSHGRINKSKFIVYKPSDIKSASYKNGYYQVYKNDRIKDITMPNMSQGICWNSNNMLTLFESAATIYSEEFFKANVITDCFCKLDIIKICVNLSY